MPSTRPLLFKLDQSPASRGLRCDHSGLFLAGQPLLERDEVDRFRPHTSNRIRKIFNDAYRAETDWESRVRSVKVVADALNKGDLARATMAAVLMRLPEPDGPIRIADVDGILAKAGFDPDEPRDERGRWTEDSDNGGAKAIPTLKRGKLDSSHGNRGFGGTYDQCVRGQVSQACGGSAVEFEVIA